MSPAVLLLAFLCGFLFLASSDATQQPHATPKATRQPSSLSLLPTLSTSPSPTSPSTAAAPPSMNGTWTVAVDSPIHPLSIDLWGIFYEEIGFSGQGGIHQQQIYNGNFESTSADYAPWDTLPAAATADVQYVVSLTQDYPINAYNPTSMAVEARVSGAAATGDGVEVGVLNPGYWGISLLERRAFNLSLFVMSPTVSTLTARLQSNSSAMNRTTYAEATVSVTQSWSKQSTILQLDSSSHGADDSAILTLTWTATAPSSTLYLDVVSLLPSNGYSSVPWLRPDLGSLVAELRPSVVRLPGGCYVEGGRLSNRFNWKRAVGDAEQRKGHLNDVSDNQHQRAHRANAVTTPHLLIFHSLSLCVVIAGVRTTRIANTTFSSHTYAPACLARAAGPLTDCVVRLVWFAGYFVEDQLGVFEYFQWAESLRDAYGQPTRVVWVVNSGTAHSDSIPVSHISGWVQDALDSIDFIRGSSDNTVWGRRRAEMGRTEPFQSLKYLAIGNEDCGKPYYEANYRVFYAALQAAHPDLVLISNCSPTDIDASVQVWDYHVYPTYDWFLANEGQWDTYNRSGLVYVSEYATHGGQGKGNLRAALAEAVYMLGMERNADLITMAAYAPLLTNVEGRPDNIQQAVLFNHRSSYGTPSYWTQWMFARAVEGATSGSVHTVKHTLQSSGSGTSQLHNVSVGALVGSINASTSLVVLKIVNYNLVSSVTLSIQLTGVAAESTVQSVMEVRTLASESQLDENSFDEPMRVAVVESGMDGGAATLAYTAAANSFTVLRLFVSEQGVWRTE